MKEKKKNYEFEQENEQEHMKRMFTCEGLWRAGPLDEDEEQGNSKEKEKPLDDHIDTKVYEDKVNIGNEENGTCEGNLHCVSLARSFYPTSKYSFSLQIIIMFKQR